jgi:siroheme synthase-like protein
VTGYPVLLDGSKVSALVVGGGAVALRKVRALLDAGVRVALVAKDIDPELHTLAENNPRLTVILAPYSVGHIADATIVIAATDNAGVNARVASDAMKRHRLVNVVDAPSSGTFQTPAVHRAGDLTIAVSAGGLPAAAAAIRDTVAERFDGRYASAIAALRDLRERLLANGERDQWKTISRETLGDSFCSDVESRSLSGKVASWR